MTEYSNFKVQCDEEISSMSLDVGLQAASMNWINRAVASKYSYHFEFLGRPVIQFPQDIIAMQELIWQVKPDLIIETGIAHGGSLILSASMLAMLDYCDAIEQNKILDPKNTPRRVLGIDIDIRDHNLKALKAHPLSNRIDVIQGSSVDPKIIAQVREKAENYERVLVCLDSSHTHEHVLAELEAYAPLVTLDSYCVVFDTIIEDLPDELFSDRPWGKGDNPKTAVWQYLVKNTQFEIDKQIHSKLLITVAPDGYLRKIR